MHKASFRIRRSGGPKHIVSIVAFAAMLLLIAPPTAALALTPPAASNPAFAPSSPRTNTQLEASTGVGDLDDDDVGVTFAWSVTRDGNTCALATEESAPATPPSTHVKVLDLSQPIASSNCSGASLGTINVQRGDTVRVTVTPHDAHDGQGLPASNTVTVQNTPPAADPFTLSPPGPKTNQTATALTKITDGDNDQVRATIAWTVTRGANTCLVRSTTDRLRRQWIELQRRARPDADVSDQQLHGDQPTRPPSTRPGATRSRPRSRPTTPRIRATRSWTTR